MKKNCLKIVFRKIALLKKLREIDENAQTGRRYCKDVLHLRPVALHRCRYLRRSFNVLWKTLQLMQWTRNVALIIFVCKLR